MMESLEAMQMLFESYQRDLFGEGLIITYDQDCGRYLDATVQERFNIWKDSWNDCKKYYGIYCD